MHAKHLETSSNQEKNSGYLWYILASFIHAGSLRISVSCWHATHAKLQQRKPLQNGVQPSRIMHNASPLYLGTVGSCTINTDSKNWRCRPRTGLTRWDPGPFTLTISHGTWKRFPWDQSLSSKQQNNPKQAVSKYRKAVHAPCLPIFLPEERWRFWQPFCLGTCFIMLPSSANAKSVTNEAWCFTVCSP